MPSVYQTLQPPKKVKKPNTSYFSCVMVWDISTKVGPQGDVLGTLCVGLDRTRQDF